MRTDARLVSSALLCGALLGCEGHTHGGSRGSSFPTGAAGLAALATAAEIVSAIAQPKSPSGDPTDDPTDDPDARWTPDPPPAGAVDPHHAFDPIPVLQAIDALDLGKCTHYGAFIGWGHARLTFDATGAATDVVVESPDGLPPSAVECIRGGLASISASRFEGDPVTIGASYFVR